MESIANNISASSIITSATRRGVAYNIPSCFIKNLFDFMFKLMGTNIFNIRIAIFFSKSTFFLSFEKSI